MTGFMQQNNHQSNIFYINKITAVLTSFSPSKFGLNKLYQLLPSLIFFEQMPFYFETVDCLYKCQLPKKCFYMVQWVVGRGAC